MLHLPLIVKDQDYVSTVTRPLEELVVCPVCKGRLTVLKESLTCRSCRASYARLDDRSIDLMPPSWSDQPEHDWTSRQVEMEGWYRDLLSDPDVVVSCFNNDYEPFRNILATLRGSIVDIGGGNGIVRDFLPENTSYVVVDPSLDWLDVEWTYFSDSFPSLAERPTFVRGVGEHLPFPPSSVDHALSFWSLNHARDPGRVFQEVYSVLRRQGRFLVVLEDTKPQWRDLPHMLSLQARPRDKFRQVTAKLLASTGVRAWPLQSDHIRIEERDIRRWIKGAFSIVERKWVSRYLTYVLRRL